MRVRTVEVVSAFGRQHASDISGEVPDDPSRYRNAAALTALVLLPATAKADCDPFAGAYTTNLPGCSDHFLVGGSGASGSWSVTTTYAGTSAGYWHSLWAFTLDQYNASSWAAGQQLALKDQVGRTETFSWTGGTEIIFGLFVQETNQWLFSGPVGRNTGLTQIQLFGVPVLADDRSTVMASPNGNSLLFGFEDTDFRNDCVKGKTETDSNHCGPATGDRDFNDAVFRVVWSQDPFDPPQETVPEPATMTLLATGLAGMAAARRRRKG